MLHCCYLQLKVATRCCYAPCQLTMQQQCSSPHQARTICLWTSGLASLQAPQLRQPQDLLLFIIVHHRYLCLACCGNSVLSKHPSLSFQAELKTFLSERTLQGAPPPQPSAAPSWASFECYRLLQEHSTAYDPCLLICSCKQLCPEACLCQAWAKGALHAINVFM